MLSIQLVLVMFFEIFETIIDGVHSFELSILVKIERVIFCVVN